MSLKVIRSLFALVLALLTVSINANANAKQTFTLSVVPQFTPVDIGMRWTPLLHRLTAETGYGFQLRLIDKIPRFETDFAHGTPDLLYLNPYHMIMAAKSQGYLPLVRGTEPLVGILVVDKQGPIQRLSDLNGKRLAFPAPNAFGASLYMRAQLIEQEGLSFLADYVGTHQNAYRHVLFGEAVAAGGIETTLERESDGLKQRLRVLYTTPSVPPHPLAAHPRLPADVREKIIAAMLKIGRDQAGQKLLADVGLAPTIRADYIRDYLPLEKLKLERHVIHK
jgi:phosphonate transport system substrate-binding protein